MKGWGKSPPRRWQQGRHGKPHREQDRIGMTRGTRKRRYSLFPGQSSGWVARGSVQTLSQMNGCHVPGNRGHTEPGLQANWRILLLLLPPARRFWQVSAKRLKLRPENWPDPFPANDAAACVFVPISTLETEVSNHSLSLTAYQYLQPAKGGARAVPIDAHIVPWYPIYMLLRGTSWSPKSGNCMVSPSCWVSLFRMVRRLV